MAIQVRRGNEADFDASKMLPGELAVSLDARYVRMCFAPGIVLRMATYDSFEADMSQIKSILAECKSIQSAVQRIQSEVNSKASLTIEYANSAKQSADRAYSEAERAKTYANNAEAVTGVQIATKDRAGLIKGGDNHIAEDGTLMLITETTDTTMPNSFDGRLLVNEIKGVCQQGANPSPTSPQEIKYVKGKNLLENTMIKELVSAYGATFTPQKDGSIVVSGNASQWFPQAINQKLQLKPGENYTFTGCPAGAGYRTYYMYIEIKLSDGGSVVHREEGGGVTFTYPKNAVSAFVAFGINENVAMSNLRFYPMIRKASIADSTYVPYGLLRVKTHGKNFLNALNVFDFGEAPPNYEGLLQLKIEVPNGAYTISTNVPLGIGNVASVLVSDNGFSYTSSENGVSIGMPKSITISDGNLYVAFRVLDLVEGRINVTREDFVNGKYWVQIEEGTVATTYEPYKESSVTLSKPIDLYGIGDVQDTIIPKQIKRKFVKISNYDTFTISPYGNKEKHYGYVLVPSGSANFETSGNILCSHLPLIDGGSHYKGSEIGVALYPTAIGICVDIPTVTEVKSWLVENEVEFICQTATETTEELPLADQVALNSLATYDGITYLEFDSEVQPTFEGEYGTSKVGGYTLEGMLAGRNGELMGKDYANRITALETAMVNNI